MAFWKNKQKNSPPADLTEVLYLSEEGDATAARYESAAPAVGDTNAAAATEVMPKAEQPGLFSRKESVSNESRNAKPINAALSVESTASEQPSTSPAPSAVEMPEASFAPVRPTKESKSTKKTRDAKPAEVENWRKGVKGRASQVFIGFLSNSSKRDAVKYAVGVAEQNAVNAVNAAYAVFPWNNGWAYEVHEGGPVRAYLPSILKYFDAQGDHGKAEELVITITTAGRSVRVERSHTGLTAFVMPESFAGNQTEWLEPGPKLKPAVPIRIGVLAAGGAVFVTGFLAMMLALAKRPDPPLVTNTERSETRFEQLPLSQWPTLLSAASNGYVDSLEYSAGQWKISRAASSKATAITTPPPPLPTPATK